MGSPFGTGTQRLLTATLAGAVVMLLARHAAAQTAQPTQTSVVPPAHWTVTPFIGFGFSGDLDSATGALGAAAGYMWNDRATLEGEFTLLPSSESGGVIEVGTKVWSLTGNLLYHFAGRSVIPYGVIGLGFGHASADVSSSALSLETSSTSFIVNFGGGVERRIADRLAIRGDFRYFFGGDLVPDYWRASAGLNFDLGRRR